MPCRSCKRNISAEDAAFGVCPHCGNLLDLVQPLPSSNYSFQPVTSAPKKRSKATLKSKKLVLIAGGTVLTCLGLLSVAGVILTKAFSKQSVAVDNSNLGIISVPELPAEIEGKSAPVSKESTTATPFAAPEPASTASSGDEVTELLRKQQIVLREDIIKRVDAALKLVKETGLGHVVVGKLKMQGSASVRDVIAQMEILDDGYFVDAVATAGAPIYFWHQGYDRLEVLPKGKKLSIENLGDLTMQATTRPSGTLKGLLFANGGEVPKDVKGTIDYYLPFINVCKSNDSERQTLETELRSRLKPFETAKIDVVADTGEFQISQLAELPFGALLQSSLNHSWAMPLEAFPGEELNVGQVVTSREDETWEFQSPEEGKQRLSQLEWAANGQPAVKILLAKIKDKPLVTKYFQERLGKLLKKVEAFRKIHGERSAVVIVGQIVGPSSRELLQGKTQVRAQMRMAPDGYFCAAVGPGRPVGFRFRGFDSLDYVPRGSHDGVEYCGVLRMTKTNPLDFASVQSSLFFEAGQVPAKFKVWMIESSGRSSLIDWEGDEEGTTPMGAAGWLEPKFRDTQFQFSQLSPLGYVCNVEAKGFVSQFRDFQLMPKEDRTLRPPILMFRSRNIKLTYLASTAGNFVNSKLRQAVVSTEAKIFRCFDDAAIYNAVSNDGQRYDLLFYQKGNTISSNGAHVMDLGIRIIEECTNIDVNGVVFRGRSECLVRPGHVYLAKRVTDAWVHWILFRLDSIELAPIDRQ